MLLELSVTRKKRLRLGAAARRVWRARARSRRVPQNCLRAVETAQDAATAGGKTKTPVMLENTFRNAYFLASSEVFFPLSLK